MNTPKQEGATAAAENPEALKKLEAENTRLKDENARLKNHTDWANRFYWRSLVLLLGVGAAQFVYGPVYTILSNDIKDVSLAWVYGIKVFGSITVLCALLWTLLVLVRSDPDQRD